MMEIAVPFSIPEAIEPQLGLVRDYWESLKRAGNEMPFWDDVKLTALPDLSSQLMLIDVYELPTRFRFNHVGNEIERRYGEKLGNKFVDEIQILTPLEYLLSQCSATIEARRSTYYRHAAKSGQSGAAASYSRLLLPMWGDGHIGMLLGGYAWH